MEVKPQELVDIITGIHDKYKRVFDKFERNWQREIEDDKRLIAETREELEKAKNDGNEEEVKRLEGIITRLEHFLSIEKDVLYTLKTFKAQEFENEGE